MHPNKTFESVVGQTNKWTILMAVGQNLLGEPVPRLGGFDTSSSEPLMTVCTHEPVGLNKRPYKNYIVGLKDVFLKYFLGLRFLTSQQEPFEKNLHCQNRFQNQSFFMIFHQATSGDPISGGSPVFPLRSSCCQQRCFTCCREISISEIWYTSSTCFFLRYQFLTKKFLQKS